uniref:NADH-ubiquinone oxidoreductase chain 4L n=1 Tax=Pholoe pallida TaxID=328599 RepID=A0A343W6L2_9ANNE|nr:NADH dehydrogenase subunit 4L [Pholoe pallida]
MTFISSSIPSSAPLIPILTMILQRKHVLMALLAFEAMILSLTYMLLISTQPLNGNELFLSLILLSFGACEASLGLAVLVAMTRSTGSDRISSSSLSKC